MKSQFNLLFAIICLLVITTPQAHAAKPKAPQQVQKERLVLMPLRIPEEDKSLQGAMETALVQGLQQKYEVFSGEQVAQKARQIFMKESKAAKKDCDETRCMQGIAEAFQAELIATANVTKRDGGYFLAISVQNIFDNLVVYSNSVPCKNCDSFQVVEKLKELSGASVPVAAAPAVPAPQTAAEPEVPKITATDPESALWEEVKKGNTAEDYKAYLSQYPKGKFIALAKTKLARLKEEAKAAAEQQEQQAWNDVQQSASRESYDTYLSAYPQGRFAALAQARIAKLKKEETDAEARQKREQLAEEARQKREQAGAAKNAGKGPAMVKIPGKNYELGKYEVTQKEWRDIMGNNPSHFKDCGDTCPVEQMSWDDIQAYLKKLNTKTGRQYRLPTEAEWEYACHGGSPSEYCGGGNIDAVAWYKDNSGGQTHPVGQKQANGYGLYDMSGNVFEWQSDCYNGDCAERVLRGGSWIFDPNYSRSAFRNFNSPANRLSIIGFRVARTLP